MSGEDKNAERQEGDKETLAEQLWTFPGELTPQKLTAACLPLSLLAFPAPHQC